MYLSIYLSIYLTVNNWSEWDLGEVVRVDEHGFVEANIANGMAVSRMEWDLGFFVRVNEHGLDLLDRLHREYLCPRCLAPHLVYETT